eukprot:gene566-1091_t
MLTVASIKILLQETEFRIPKKAIYRKFFRLDFNLDISAKVIGIGKGHIEIEQTSRSFGGSSLHVEVELSNALALDCLVGWDSAMGNPLSSDARQTGLLPDIPICNRLALEYSIKCINAIFFSNSQFINRREYKPRYHSNGQIDCPRSGFVLKALLEIVLWDVGSDKEDRDVFRNKDAIYVLMCAGLGRVKIVGDRANLRMEAIKLGV